MFTFTSLRCSNISRLWTKKFQFEKGCCHVKEVLSSVPVNIQACSWIIHLWRIKFALTSESLAELFFKDPLYIKAERRCLACDFSDSAGGLLKTVWTERGNNVGNGERTWSVRAEPRETGTGRKKDRLLSTTAAHPAFFQGYAINKAAFGSPGLLAVPCLFWLLCCLVPALPLTTGFSTHWRYNGMLRFWHWWLPGTSAVQ